MVLLKCMSWISPRRAVFSNLGPDLKEILKQVIDITIVSMSSYVSGFK